MNHIRAKTKEEQKINCIKTATQLYAPKFPNATSFWIKENGRGQAGGGGGRSKRKKTIDLTTEPETPCERYDRENNIKKPESPTPSKQTPSKIVKRARGEETKALTPAKTAKGKKSAAAEPAEAPAWIAKQRAERESRRKKDAAPEPEEEKEPEEEESEENPFPARFLVSSDVEIHHKSALGTCRILDIEPHVQLPEQWGGLAATTTSMYHAVMITSVKPYSRGFANGAKSGQKQKDHLPISFAPTHIMPYNSQELSGTETYCPEDPEELTLQFYFDSDDKNARKVLIWEKYLAPIPPRVGKTAPMISNEEALALATAHSKRTAAPGKGQTSTRGSTRAATSKQKKS